MSKVWFVTGSARGLGRDIVEAALAAGDRVVATARDPSRLADLVAQHGDRVRAVELDVTDAVAAQAAVRAALDAFGRIDVLVNNAGFGRFSPFEQTSEAEFREQIDANFYGVVNVTRAALPSLVAQRSGYIFHISSVGGRLGSPGLSAYQAAKWAVGGFTEVLRGEVGPLGVKVTAVEPGGMRTDWGPDSMRDMPEPLPQYVGLFEGLKALRERYIGNEAGDPKKVAQILVALAGHDDPPAHLLLGSDALQYAGAAQNVRAAAEETWRTVSASSDFAAPSIPPLPR